MDSDFVRERVTYCHHVYKYYVYASSGPARIRVEFMHIIECAPISDVCLLSIAHCIPYSKNFWQDQGEFSKFSMVHQNFTFQNLSRIATANEATQFAKTNLPNC